MAKAATLNIDIVASATKALDAFDKVKEKATGANTGMKIAAVGAATAILGALGDCTKAAADHEVQVAKLGTAYQDAGLSTKDMKGDLEDVEASTRRTGQSTEDSINAYTRLVIATKDTAKAHSELSLAQDLAAAKGISVSDAAQLVVKASEGQTKALKAMGIATTDASGKQLSAAAIMANLTAAVHGQADAFGKTAVGEMGRYHQTLDQTKEKIGAALLPALQSVLKTLQPLFNWLSQNSAVLAKLAPIVAIVAGVVIAVTTAVRIWIAVQTVLNVVLTANPIGVIIVAIAALVAGVIYAYRNCAVFRQAIQDVWNWIKILGEWVLSHWKIVVDVLLGPLGLLITNFQTVEAVIMDVIHALEEVGSKVSDAMKWLGKIPSGAGSILSKLPFSLPGGEGPAPAPVIISIQAVPGDDLPQVVYDALRRYQRQHSRPELRPLFGP